CRRSPPRRLAMTAHLRLHVHNASGDAARKGDRRMFIKSIVIEGVEGDVEIARTEGGALVTIGRTVLCEMRRDEDREARYAKASEVAKVICGRDRSGRPNATNSMIHDVLDAIERVAVC